MNSVLGFGMLFLVLSCSTVLWKERGESVRSISSYNSIEVKSQEELSCFSQNKASFKDKGILEYLHISSTAQVGLSLNKVFYFKDENCALQVHSLEYLDEIVYVDDSTDRVLIRSLHGKLIIIDQKKIEAKLLGFPVSSFEITGDELHLYNANTTGRFCDHYQLSLPEGDRDKSCQLIAEKIKF